MKFRYVLVLVLLGNSAMAEVAADCAKMSDGGERLICYDGIFRTDAEAVPSQSKWQVSTETSKIDDSKAVFLTVSSEDGFPGKYRNQEQKATLWIRCHENATALILKFGDHFMSDVGGYGDVTFRIDEQKAFTRSLDESTDHGSLGLWSGGGSIPVIKQMLGKSRLTVRATPYSESPIVTTFLIAGLDDAIKPLREACKW